MQLTCQFRLYPTPDQEKQMFHTLTLCRQLYNASLEQRETAYKEQGKSVTYTMQQNELPALKKRVPAYQTVHSQVLQNVLLRLDDAFERFLKGEAGYPHYKSRDHYTSFTYTQPGAVQKTFTREGAVYISKIGFVRMNTHREFDSKAVTQLNIKYEAGQWAANLSMKIHPPEPMDVLIHTVGLDVGLRSFAALSDETIIVNPRLLRKAEKRLARSQRRLSRKQKGSKNRAKAKRRVAKAHRKIVRQRNDFLHKESVRIVRDHDLIAVEQLEVKKMIRNRRFSKSIADAGWGRFITFLTYKAAKQGKRLVKVPAHGTSQTCVCGKPAPKDLSVREHHCITCGLTMDRDIVSAKVILQRALALAA